MMTWSNPSFLSIGFNRVGSAKDFIFNRSLSALS